MENEIIICAEGEKTTVGNGVTAIGGIYGEIEAGVCCTVIGGIDCILSAGKGSVLCWKVRVGGTRKMISFQVGQNGIKAGARYSLGQDGKPVFHSSLKSLFGNR